MSSVYEASVEAVLDAMAQTSTLGTCPTLLCVPDLLVRGHPPTPGERQPQAERIVGRLPSQVLDGHACISALTAAHLCLGLSSEYQVWLAVKTGAKGKELLGQAQAALQRSGCTLFRPFVADGVDGWIEVPRDTAKKVGRIMMRPDPSKQLDWSDVFRLGLHRWLRGSDYSIVVGDASAPLVSGEGDQFGRLSNDAAALVCDTEFLEEDPDQAVEMWSTLQELAKGQRHTFVSISSDDARNIAGAVGVAGAASDTELARALATSLAAGFVVLHGPQRNLVVASDHSLEVEVPACAIDPKSTNGAGDTFNGAFALAATSLLLQRRSDGEPRVDQDALTLTLGFATAVVSLRLEAGQYPTRYDVLEGTRDLRACDASTTEQTETPEYSSRTISPSATLAQLLAPVWSDYPRVALVDLDHTLCDSKKWRELATVSALRSLDLRPLKDEELESFYDSFYSDHDLWAPMIRGNIRYVWKLREFFELVLALNELWDLRNYEALRDRVFSDEEERRRLEAQVGSVRTSSDAIGKIDRALKEFDLVPAHPYPDAVAGLYQLRDILGFTLILVTEGHDETQQWKLDQLGLRTLFPRGRLHSDEAFASQQQIEETFSRARGSDSDTNQLLDEAKEILLRLHPAIKASFRAHTLETIVQDAARDAGFSGLHVCTIGDRIDTDVVPYLRIREKSRQPSGEHGGFVVARVPRGPYVDQSLAQSQETFSEEEARVIEVQSVLEVAGELAAPNFWRHEPGIEQVTAVERPSVSDPDWDKLLNVRRLHGELTALVDKILSYVRSSSAAT